MERRIFAAGSVLAGLGVVFTGTRWIGAITPIGGVTLIARLGFGRVAIVSSSHRGSLNIYDLFGVE